MIHSLKITKAADLTAVAAALHDARFIAGGIDFNRTARSFILKCRVFEPKSAALDSSRHWQAYRLSFANVIDCEVNVREKVPYYELATIRFAPRERRLDLVTHYGIEIGLRLGEFYGILA